MLVYSGFCLDRFHSIIFVTSLRQAGLKYLYLQCTENANNLGEEKVWTIAMAEKFSEV
jgi:hypothetical protein